MILRERVFKVVSAFGRPMSVQRLSRKMRARKELLGQHVTKLHSYGYLTRVRTTVHRETKGNNVVRHFYVPSGKQFEART